MIGLELFAEPRRLDWCEAMMRVMQEIDVVAKFGPQRLEEHRHDTKVFLRGPSLFRRQTFFCRLVVKLVLRNAIDAAQARHTGLCTDGAITHAEVFRDFID